jgi:hypothetical protein
MPKGLQGDRLILDPNQPTGMSWERPRVAAPETVSAYYQITVAKQHNTLTKGTVTWLALLTSWGTHIRDDAWTESSGSWVYGGHTTRKFLITWSFTFQWHNGAAGNGVMLGRITKDTGSGAVAITGSEQHTSPYAQLLFFGSYLHNGAASGECVVEVDQGDKIAFQYGAQAGGSGTYNVTNLYTTINGDTTTAIQLTITPAQERLP